jgi:hypothetical protein
VTDVDSNEEKRFEELKGFALRLELVRRRLDSSS